MHAMTQAMSPTPLPSQLQAIELKQADAGHSGISDEAALLLAQARNMAFAEAAQGRLGEGLSLLQIALEQEPMAHDLLSDMAALLLSAGELVHAQAAAEKALALQPQHGPSLYSLAFALAGQGQVLRAREVLQRLLKGAALASLQAEAPELLPLVQSELLRLKGITRD